MPDEDEEKPRTDIDDDDIKHDVVEYFGAKGKDEGPRFIDAGEKEEETDGDDYGKGSTVVG